MQPMSRSRSPEAVKVDGLRSKVVRVDRRLVVVNGVCFTSLVVLAGAAPGLLATEVVGQINLGLLLCIALGVLTLGTSVAYDRRMARECDPEAERLRERAEERAEALAAEAEQRAAAQQRWGAGQGFGYRPAQGYGYSQGPGYSQGQGHADSQGHAQAQSQGWGEW